MSDLIIVAYQLSAVDNHGYFFEDAPESIFCDKCGCCIDYSYLPTELKVSNKCDLGYTYDHRAIVSLRFKEFIESLNFKVDFPCVNAKKQLYLMKPQCIIEFEAYQKENYCNKCHQYFDQVMPDATFYKKTKRVLQEGIFFTSNSFGSGKELCPLIIIGIKTAEIINNVKKLNKFRGLDISPVKSKPIVEPSEST